MRVKVPAVVGVKGVPDTQPAMPVINLVLVRVLLRLNQVLVDTPESQWASHARQVTRADAPGRRRHPQRLVRRDAEGQRQQGGDKQDSQHKKSSTMTLTFLTADEADEFPWPVTAHMLTKDGPKECSPPVWG